MEHVTPIFNFFKSSRKDLNITGSEFFGFNKKSGKYFNGIRHENIEKLSFSDESFDLIVSNDVFEHVPNPKFAFRECSRVLKNRGVLIATFPFKVETYFSFVRAKIIKNNIKHFATPEYHGNPLSDKGSLVFTDFGWDVLDLFYDSGFSKVSVDLYSSRFFGYIGVQYV